MSAELLQCPFCASTSTRGTGLTAHIRGRHPKEYSKWIKDPHRLQAARKGAAPKTAASASDVPGPAVCPECSKTFKNEAALGGHRAYLHKGPKKVSELASPQIVAAVPTDNALKKGAGAAKLQTPGLSHPAASSPIVNSAHEHLRAAREALVGRDHHIEGELKRLTELQAEKERVRRELDAVNAALQVFGDNFEEPSRQ